MKINMEAYKETKSFLEKELSEFELNEQERKHYQYALNSIKNILDFHNSHIDSMKNASSYLKDRASNNQEFDLSELRKLEDFVSELDYLQYRLLLTSLRMVESFKFIEKNERLSHADKDIKLFIKEFANSENTIKREVSKVEYIEGMDNLSKGEHKEKVIEYLYEKQDRDFKKLKKDVRNL